MSLAVPNDDDYQEIQDIEEHCIEMQKNRCYTVPQQPTKNYKSHINASAEIYPGGSCPSPSGVKRAASFIGVIVVIGVVLLCVACIICFAFAFIEITELKAQLNDQGNHTILLCIQCT